MNEHVTIYSLSDPFTLEVRYVGVTKQNAELRLKDHIYESKVGGKTHKCSWIRKVLRKKAIPVLDVVDHVPLVEWEFWEQHWIAQFKQWGFKLTNSTLGGRGTLGRSGWKHAEETKKLIRARNSGVNNYNYGKTLSEEWKKKISESVKGEKNGFFGKKHTNETLEKRRNPVLQYSLDGIFIREWQSMKSATIGTGVKDISMACSGKIHSAGGFQWRKKLGTIDENIPSARPYRKAVAQIDVKTGETVKVWDSIRQAEQTLNLSHISKVCLGYKSHKTIGGYKWQFA